MSSNDSEHNEIENYQQVDSSSSIISTISLPAHYFHNEQQQNNHNQLHNLKKQGVSGESCDASIIGHSSDILIRKYEKDFK